MVVVVAGRLTSAAGKDRVVIEERLFQSVQDLRLGRQFTFERADDLKHRAWLELGGGDGGGGVGTSLSLPLTGPDLNLTEHLWKFAAVHRHFTSNLTELERICQEQPDKLSRPRCAKLEELFPGRVCAAFPAQDSEGVLMYCTYSTDD